MDPVPLMVVNCLLLRQPASVKGSERTCDKQNQEKDQSVLIPFLLTCIIHTSISSITMETHSLFLVQLKASCCRCRL